MRIISSFISVAVIIILASCTQPVDIEAEKAAVMTVTDDFWEAFKDRDIEQLRNLCSEDIVVIGHDIGQRFEGRQAFADHVEPYFEMEGFDLGEYTRENQHLKISPGGDAAWYSETYTEEILIAGQDSVTYGGEITLGLEKRNGKWSIIQYHVSYPDAPEIPAGELDTAIEEVKNRLRDLFNNGDLDELMHLYTDDAVVMAPGSELITGKAAIRETFENYHKMGSIQLELVTDKLIQTGKSVIDIGSYTNNVKLNSGEQLEFKGQQLFIWQMDSTGSWKLRLEMWNTYQSAE
jgi:ketosteroid isomerase-like protein